MQDGFSPSPDAANPLGQLKKADSIYEQKLKGRYMNVVIANMWNRRRKRWGGKVHIINTNILRRNFSLFAYV